MPLAYQSSPLSLGTTQHKQKLRRSLCPCSFLGLALIPLTPWPEAAPRVRFPFLSLCRMLRLSFLPHASILSGPVSTLLSSKGAAFFKRPHLHLWFNSNVINTMKPPLTTTPSQKSPVVFSLSPILCSKRTLSAPLCHLPLSAPCGICIDHLYWSCGQKLYPHVSVKHLEDEPCSQWPHRIKVKSDQRIVQGCSCLSGKFWFSNLQKA